MKKKILVLGGGAYQLRLIERIKELGHSAYCVDGNPDALGFKIADFYKHIDVLDKDACLCYAKEIGIDAVMTYGATLTLPTVSYIAQNLSLAALPMQTAELSKSKYKIKARLAEYGCNTRGSFFEMTGPHDAEIQPFEFPCVIKPSDGSGSKGVSVVNCQSELKAAVDYAYANARYGKFYVEGFVKGEEYSVEAFVCNGKAYVYAIVKTTFRREPSGEISYGHRTPSGLSAQDELCIQKEVEKAIRALNITMASVNFDVILADDDKKPYIIDCGIRIGQNLIASHIVPLSRGVSIIDNTISLALGEKIDPNPKQNKCIATRLLIYSPGVILEIKPFDDVIGKNGVVDIVMRKGVGDEQKPYREKSDTCGWVIAEGATPDEAEANAAKAKDELKNYIIIG